MKLLFRLILVLIALVGLFVIYLYIELQPTKLDEKYSTNNSYSIYRGYGDENQELPYAPVVYLEKHSFIPLLSSKEIIFSGYCDPSYVWVNDSKVEFSCEVDGEYVKNSNSFNVNVIFKITHNE
ncbi:hypothetical protein [Vibrio splendidus]|uniref:hypothetical protein n=1 Tax=Vibrio splendidus TaxID=29497 RepID=UPI000C8357DB|nr:hypothetical protein BCU38_22795 [Vibrio splendidus]